MFKFFLLVRIVRIEEIGFVEVMEIGIVCLFGSLMNIWMVFGIIICNNSLGKFINYDSVLIIRI